MGTFLAVLKDSFREAVDGFVIYVMLGLALIAVAVAASVSFHPEPADSAFQSVAKSFQQVFQNRGASREEVATRVGSGLMTQRMPMPVDYTVTDIQKTDGGSGVAGTYKFRLTARPADFGPTRGGGGMFNLPAGLRLQPDNFKTAIAAWIQPKPVEQNLLIQIPEEGSKLSGPPKFETVPDGENPEEFKNAKKEGRWMLMSSPKVSAAELDAVTDDVMAEFLKQQLALHGGIDQATVKRAGESKPPEYTFDVEAKVPALAKGWTYKSYIFFGALPLSRTPQQFGPVVLVVQDVMVNTIGAAVTLLVAVILTAFFIPNMLRKGSLDLIIAKPLSRWQLLLYKYIGGLTFMLLVSACTVGGVWLVTALRTGDWNPAFLLGIPVLTFTFAALYAVSTLTAVLTRSAVAAIIVTAVFMFLMWGVGFTKSLLDTFRADSITRDWAPGWLYTTIDVANAALPRYNDVLKLNSRELNQNLMTPALVKVADRLDYPSWGVAVGVTLAYVAGLLGLSYWRFATRDP
jgi:ABC-type transport system involved in multi-copper enzyme maturation permease subunit